MQRAIHAMKKDGMAWQTAAKKFNVPRNTLKCRFLNKNQQATDNKNCLGHYRAVFYEEQEQQLVNHLLDMESKPEEIKTAIRTALDVGYRHVDTASAYKNEEAIGEVIAEWVKSTGKRDELFITTKLPHYGNRPSDVSKYLKLSLQKLQLDYVDMYLLHMPFTTCPDETGEAPAKHEDGTFVFEDTDHISLWKEMEKQVDCGLAKSIGISNFNMHQVERLMAHARIPPANLQTEMHAALQQKDLLESCKKQNIAVTAYSPLGSPGAKLHFSTKYGVNDAGSPDILHEPAVVQIAESLKHTPAQVVLRFLVQQGIAVIPKSVNPQRIKENSQIFDFELDDNDMNILRNLDRGPKGRIINFLFFKGVEKHPEYPFRDELAGKN